MATRFQAVKLALGLSVVGAVVVVLGTAESARAGHRTVRRSVSTAPGNSSGSVRSYYGPVRKSGVGTVSAYGFSRSRRAVRPVRQVQRRYVPVTNYRFNYSPYAYSSFGYSHHNYCSPAVGISFQRPGFSFGYSRGGFGNGVTIGIFGR
ncbi:hypothetical protein OAJ60_01350 [Planctomycetaceae bacterium]|nr:hypothetical protein [Planctomycetaceae bacterium]